MGCLGAWRGKAGPGIAAQAALPTGYEQMSPCSRARMRITRCSLLRIAER